jgi:chemotaxis protein MotB
MAGKGGGGSWKVAYADFVTAMMAFFLVMWLSAQDQSVKQAVANYFNRTDPIGASKKPGRPGSVFSSEIKGDVPMGDAIALGKGRSSYTQESEPSPATKLVGDWIHHDQPTHEPWKEQARRQRELASQSADNPDDAAAAQKVAAKRLAAQMRTEFTLGTPAQLKSVYQDLVLETLVGVNWSELAEDLLVEE